MPYLVRITMLVLSLVLATGATVHAAAAAEMKIAMSAGAGMDMKACPGCGSETHGKAASCDLVCSAPAAAILPGEGAGAFLQVRAVLVQQADLVMSGVATGPDPSRPRTIIIG